MLIKTKVYPESSEEEVIALGKDAFEVYVQEKPVKGQATRAVARALAKHFNIDPCNIRIVRGFKTRNKIFEVKQ